MATSDITPGSTQGNETQGNDVVAPSKDADRAHRRAWWSLALSR